MPVKGPRHSGAAATGAEALTCKFGRVCSGLDARRPILDPVERPSALSATSVIESVVALRYAVRQSGECLIGLDSITLDCLSVHFSVIELLKFVLPPIIFPQRPTWA